MEILNNVKRAVAAVVATVAMALPTYSADTNAVVWTDLTTELNDVDPRLQLGTYIQNVSSNAVKDTVIPIVEEYVSPITTNVLKQASNITENAVNELARTNSVLSGGPYLTEGWATNQTEGGYASVSNAAMSAANATNDFLRLDGTSTMKGNLGLGGYRVDLNTNGNYMGMDGDNLRITLGDRTFRFYKTGWLAEDETDAVITRYDLSPYLQPSEMYDAIHFYVTLLDNAGIYTRLYADGASGGDFWLPPADETVSNKIELASRKYVEDATNELGKVIANNRPKLDLTVYETDAYDAWLLMTNGVNGAWYDVGVLKWTSGVSSGGPIWWKSPWGLTPVGFDSAYPGYNLLLPEDMLFSGITDEHIGLIDFVDGGTTNRVIRLPIGSPLPTDDILAKSSELPQNYLIVSNAAMSALSRTEAEALATTNYVNEATNDLHKSSVQWCSLATHETIQVNSTKVHVYVFWNEDSSKFFVDISPEPYFVVPSGILSDATTPYSNTVTIIDAQYIITREAGSFVNSVYVNGIESKIQNRAYKYPVKFQDSVMQPFVGALTVEGKPYWQMFSTSNTLLTEVIDDSLIPISSAVSNKVSKTGNETISGTKSFTTGINLMGTFRNGLNLSTTGPYSHAQGSYTQATASYSHSEGDQSTASGDHSHAEGYGTESSGIDAHSEGHSTVASGKRAHAEGFNTYATNNQSHAEGRITIAGGFHSHSEGRGSITIGDQSHAEGCQTIAVGHQSHTDGFRAMSAESGESAETAVNPHAGAYVWQGMPETVTLVTDLDIETNAVIGARIAPDDLPDPYYHSHGIGTFNINPVGGLEGFWIGETNFTDHVATLTALKRDYDDVSVNTNVWFISKDDGSSGVLTYMATRHWGNQQYELTGDRWIVGGFYWTLYTNNIPFVSIHGNTKDNYLYFSDNTNSFTLVRGSRFALDTETKGYLPLTGGTLIGDLFATQSGSDVALIAQDSTNDVAVGMGFGSDGLWPMNKENYDWILLNDYRFWFDRTENRWVLNSLTVDQENGNAEVSIKGTLGQGTNVVASGAYSHAEGVRTTSQSYGSHTEGVDTQATMSYAHAEGNGTEAAGSASHAEGIRSQTTAYGSHAEGVDTKATANYAHAEGNGTDAGGASSHAEGVRAKTTAYGSHAGGVDTIASNDYSHVWQGATGQTYGSHGIGTYNLNPANGIYGLFIGETNIVDAIRASILSTTDVTNYVYEVDTTAPIDDSTNPPPTRIVSTVSEPPLRATIESVVNDCLLKPNAALAGFSFPEYITALNKYRWDVQNHTCYRIAYSNEYAILRAVTNIDLTATANIAALKAMEDSFISHYPPSVTATYSVGHEQVTGYYYGSANFVIEGTSLQNASVSIDYEVDDDPVHETVSAANLSTTAEMITISSAALTGLGSATSAITFTVTTQYGTTTTIVQLAE